MTTRAPCVAVVDDEAPVRTMLRRVLRLADYDVVTFASGEDFLASLAASRPACVVVDLNLPGITGLEVIARLRQHDARLPAVCITASDDLALDRAVIDRCGGRLLRKPFSSDELLDAVGNAIRMP